MRNMQFEALAVLGPSATTKKGVDKRPKVEAPTPALDADWLGRRQVKQQIPGSAKQENPPHPASPATAQHPPGGFVLIGEKKSL